MSYIVTILLYILSNFPHANIPYILFSLNTLFCYLFFHSQSVIFFREGPCLSNGVGGLPVKLKPHLPLAQGVAPPTDCQARPSPGNPSGPAPRSPGGSFPLPVRKPAQPTPGPAPLAQAGVPRNPGYPRPAQLRPGKRKSGCCGRQSAPAPWWGRDHIPL